MNGAGWAAIPARAAAAGLARLLSLPAVACEPARDASRISGGLPAPHQPRYLLLDVPTSSLDLVHQQRLLSLARERARAGTGVPAVLHDLNLAARFADRVALLEEGRLICCEMPARALEPGRLTDLFGTTIHVEHHRGLNRLVVLA